MGLRHHGHGPASATNGNWSITVRANGNTSLILRATFDVGGAAGGAADEHQSMNPQPERSGWRGERFGENATLTGGSFIKTGNGMVATGGAGAALVRVPSAPGSAEVRAGTLIITARDWAPAIIWRTKARRERWGATSELVQTSGDGRHRHADELLTLTPEAGRAGALENVNGKN